MSSLGARRQSTTPSAWEMLCIGGLLCLLLVVATLAFAFYQQTHETRASLYERCSARVAYDNAANNERQAEINFYTAQITIESGNKFIDNELRRARVESYQARIDATQRAIDSAVTGNCDAYK